MLEEEVVEDEPEAKLSKSSDETQFTTASNLTTAEHNDSKKAEQPKKQLGTNSWNKSVGGISRKGGLAGLVKIKKNQGNEEKNENIVASSSQSNSVETTQNVSNGLSLLGAYSDSENSE